MLKSANDPSRTTSLPYGLLISHILLDRLVDLSSLKPLKIFATYDTRTFSSMGYVLVGTTWLKKESVKARSESVKPTRISADSAAILLRDSEEIKAQLTALEEGLEKLLNITDRLVYLNKGTSIDVGKLHLALTSVKQDGISTVHKLMK
ncbi:hypothetical protein AABB24_030166 [Solanum stoloniferum]|uniref:Uncharacterized protein n=1 Tax=Solanum stoloniferum TaxID=62892 RepID=A0ABD2S102_9SOLN